MKGTMGKRIEFMDYQKLFDYFKDSHGITLLQTDMQEVCNIINKNRDEYAEWLAEQAFIAGADWNDALFMRNEGEKCEVIDFKTWLEKIKTDTEWTGNVNY